MPEEKTLTMEELGNFVAEQVKGEMSEEKISEILRPLFDEFKAKNLSPEVIKSLTIETDTAQKVAEKDPYVGAKFMRNLYYRSVNEPVPHKDLDIEGLYSDKAFGEGTVNKAGLATGTDAAGGYIVPTEESSELINLVYHNAPIVGRCRRWDMNTDTLTIPTLSGGVTVSWVVEGTPSNIPDSMTDQSTGLKPNTTVTFGQVTLQKYSAVAIVLVSRKLLRTSMPNVQSVLNQEVPLAIADAYETAMIAGAGVAATDPVSGLDTLVTTNVTNWNAVNPVDGVFDTLAAPEEQMNEEPDLMFGNISGVKALRKVKDSNGQYLFEIGRDGSLPPIWGVPFAKAKNVVSTYGGGTDTRIYAGAFGRHAHIGLDPSMFVQVNPYTYANKNLVQFMFEINFGFTVSDEKYFSYLDQIPTT